MLPAALTAWGSRAGSLDGNAGTAGRKRGTGGSRCCQLPVTVTRFCHEWRPLQSYGLVLVQSRGSRALGYVNRRVRPGHPVPTEHPTFRGSTAYEADAGCNTGALGSYSEDMSRTSRPRPAPTGELPPLPRPITDEAVAHSHDHTCGRRGRSPLHDHSHAVGASAALQCLRRSDGTVVVVNRSVPFWSGSLSLMADRGAIRSDASGLVVAPIAAHLDAPPTRREAHVGWSRRSWPPALQAGMPSLSASARRPRGVSLPPHPSRPAPYPRWHYRPARETPSHC